MEHSDKPSTGRQTATKLKSWQEKMKSATACNPSKPTLPNQFDTKHPHTKSRRSAAPPTQTSWRCYLVHTKHRGLQQRPHTQCCDSTLLLSLPHTVGLAPRRHCAGSPLPSTVSLIHISHSLTPPMPNQEASLSLFAHTCRESTYGAAAPDTRPGGHTENGKPQCDTHRWMRQQAPHFHTQAASAAVTRPLPPPKRAQSL